MKTTKSFPGIDPDRLMDMTARTIRDPSEIDILLLFFMDVPMRAMA